LTLRQPIFCAKTGANGVICNRPAPPGDEENHGRISRSIFGMVYLKLEKLSFWLEKAGYA